MITTIVICIVVYMTTDSTLLQGVLLVVGTLFVGVFLLHKLATAIEHATPNSVAEWFHHNSRSHDRRDDAQSGTNRDG